MVRTIGSTNRLIGGVQKTERLWCWKDHLQYLLKSPRIKTKERDYQTVANLIEKQEQIPKYQWRTAKMNIIR